MMSRMAIKIVGGILGVPPPAADQQEGPLGSKAMWKSAIGPHEPKDIFSGLDRAQIEEVLSRQTQLGKDRRHFFMRERSQAPSDTHISSCDALG